MYTTLQNKFFPPEFYVDLYHQNERKICSCVFLKSKFHGKFSTFSACHWFSGFLAMVVFGELGGLGGLFQPRWFQDSMVFVVSPLGMLWAAFTVTLCWSQTQKLWVGFSPSTGPALKPEFSAKKPHKPNQQNQLVSFYLPTAFYHIFSFAPAHNHQQNTEHCDSSTVMWQML